MRERDRYNLDRLQRACYRAQDALAKDPQVVASEENAGFVWCDRMDGSWKITVKATRRDAQGRPFGWDAPTGWVPPPEEDGPVQHICPDARDMGAKLIALGAALRCPSTTVDRLVELAMAAGMVPVLTIGPPKKPLEYATLKSIGAWKTGA